MLRHENLTERPTARRGGGRPPRRRTVLALGVTATVVLAGTTALAVPAAAGTGAAPASGHRVAPDARRSATVPSRTDYDARAGATPAQTASIARHAALVSAGRSVAALRTQLGGQGVVDVDGLTGTPRIVSRLDGLLTPRSNAPATRIALSYVRSHSAVFRLGAADLAGLRLTRDYVDIAGVHHLSWTQTAGGLPLFGNGLQAAVTRHGQLVQVFGSPVPGLRAPAPVTGLRTGRSALGAALRDLHERATDVGADDSARPVLFDTTGGVRRAWETITMSAARPALHVIDAATGRVLFRKSLSSDLTDPAPASVASPPRPAATGKAFDYFPKAPVGGVTRDVNYTANGWLPADATTLSGNNSHAYSDVNDDNRPNPDEEVHPTSGSAYDYVLKPFTLPGVSFCGNPYPCTWNPNKPYSWQVNRAQSTSQVFAFVNRWHDHLEAAPIGFTEDAGNFQKINRSGSGKGGDPVDTETLDGANTAQGLPDAAHIDNANMSTPPDGTSPRMQMYLQHEPGTSYPGGDPFAPTDVGDEADTVYHEYTHGLSNRLVIDANGVSTLGNVQAGSMGEAWSDWYAMDNLVARGLQQDTATPGDVVLFQFDGAGVKLDRTEPIDCPVGTTSPRCPGTKGAGPGGYTYGDFGHVIGRPEVHADGEIWAQTLWDLRAKLGSRLTESLVTRALELSPANPSYLDERNAILTADNAIYGGHDVAQIWRVFAHRGMGWFAGALDGDDPAPAESFALPPAPDTPKGTLTGVVRAAGSGTPVPGAVVAFGGHVAGAAGGYAATTNASGRYAITGIFAGTYPKILAAARGFNAQSTTVSVRSGTTSRDFSLVPDLISSAGGATIKSFTGANYTSFGCGPVNAIDQSLGSGWGSISSLVDGHAGPKTAKQIVVRLPRPTTFGTIAIDPAATCGDDSSSGMAGYRVETSTDGTTWRTAASGTFGDADNGRLNRVTPKPGTASGVRFVRLTNEGPQALADGLSCPSSGASGCVYLDMSEIELFPPGV